MISQLEYEKSVYVTGVKVYEYEFAGATCKISAKNGENWETLFETTNVNKVGKIRIFNPELKVCFSLWLLKILHLNYFGSETKS